MCTGVHVPLLRVRKVSVLGDMMTVGRVLEECEMLTTRVATRKYQGMMAATECYVCT
jgi:uncharacterized membrane protein YecN with MAPEG domain